MDLAHPTLASPILELTGTYEFDLQFGERSYPTRIELFRAKDGSNQYRARLWQIEHCRLQPTYPQHEGEPMGEPSDETILLERSHYQRGAFTSFTASSPEDALRQVVAGLCAFLEHADEPDA